MIMKQISKCREKKQESKGEQKAERKDENKDEQREESKGRKKAEKKVEKEEKRALVTRKKLGKRGKQFLQIADDLEDTEENIAHLIEEFHLRV